MSLEQRAKILQAVTIKACGVRDLIQLQKVKNSNLISLLRKMEEEKLIDVQLAKTPKKGRPKKCVTATALGVDFLDSYKKLNLKRLQARKTDLDHAVKDALYTSRLAQRGLSPFKVFLELNSIASIISSAQ